MAMATLTRAAIRQRMIRGGLSSALRPRAEKTFNRRDAEGAKNNALSDQIGGDSAKHGIIAWRRGPPCARMRRFLEHMNRWIALPRNQPGAICVYLKRRTSM